jgi:hydroxyethylthiazole kinase
MEVYPFLKAVREKKPLVHHLTNWVTIYDCAQVVKSFHASPVMAHAPEESGDMASLASALVLNIGTLTAEFIESMKIAAKAANRKGIPVVLDVCGAGATRFRDEKNFELLDSVRIDVIKGNGSEIARIAGMAVNTKGVDAMEVEANLITVAEKLAKERKSTVVITGVEDIVADGSKHYLVKNGHELMGAVVGTGCMAASVIGTFAAVAPNDMAAAAAAGLCCYEVAAEIAVRKAGGPGTFKERLFDAIYHLTEKDVIALQRITP